MEIPKASDTLKDLGIIEDTLKDEINEENVDDLF